MTTRPTRYDAAILTTAATAIAKRMQAEWLDADTGVEDDELVNDIAKAIKYDMDGYSVADARAMLQQHRRDGVGYLAALPRPAEMLPAWVQSHRETTDGFLCAVAASHGLKLATFDTGINDASAELIT